MAIAFAAALAGLLGLPAGAEDQPLTSCLACHGAKDSGAPFVRARELANSTHHGSSCSSCHAGIRDYPHPVQAKGVDCASCHAAQHHPSRASAHNSIGCASCHGSHGIRRPRRLGSALCARCHEQAVRAYSSGVHGRARAAGAADAAICFSCHGAAHSIARVSDSQSAVSAGKLAHTCAQCHSDPTLARRHGLSASDIYKAYKTSTHAKPAPGGKPAANCADCHGHHDIRRPGDPLSPVSAAAIAKTCGRCHASEARKFASSVHGRASANGVRAAPTCVDCHGEHDISAIAAPGSRVAPGTRANACAGCHQSPRLTRRLGLPDNRVQTFRSSFHGLASRGGDIRVADCASCHGWHDVLPSSDPRSRTHPARLASTCGRCHPGAGQRWGSSTTVHQALAQEGSGSRLASLIARLYGVFIPLAVAGMLLHNSLDLSRKYRRPQGLRHRLGEVALSLPERWQHAANGAAFLLLAYSGFALHSPLSWWAAPFQALGGEAARRNAHRSAAALFLLTAAAHLFSLATKSGRLRLEALLPKTSDLSDLRRLLAYNLRLKQDKPELPQFSYIEKFEYWALIWGSLVMTATGALLFFHNAALASLPLSAIAVARVVHYFEAVLACLAILVWHGYWVLLDPEVYPMDWAWLTGKTYLPNSNDPPDEKELKR